MIYNYEYESKKELYNQYLLDESYNKLLLNNYIQESILWTNNDMNKELMLGLCEANKDGILGKFSSIWEAIQNFFKKILEKIFKRSQDQSKTLVDNKDVILGNKIQYTDKVEGYPYGEGIKRLNAIHVAEFDMNKVTNEINPESYSDTVLHKYFGLTQISCTMEELDDKLIDYFRGGEKKTMPVAQLNVQEMYNFCVDFDKNIKQPVEEERKKANQSYNKMVDGLSKLTVKKESVNFTDDLFNENRSYYSQFFDEYVVFHEQEPLKQQQPKQQEQQKPEQQQQQQKPEQQQQQKPEQQQQQQKPEQQQKQQGDQDTNNLKDGTDKSFEKTSKQCECWLKTVKIIMESKLKVLSEIYDFFMDILLKHLESYKGSDSKNTNTPDASKVNDEKVKAAVEKQKTITDVQIRAMNGNEECKDPNKFILKITKKVGDNTDIIYQNAGEGIYAAKSKDLQFKQGGISVGPKKEYGGAYMLIRNYTGQDGKPHSRYAFIDPTLPDIGATNYNDANTIKKPQK